MCVLRLGMRAKGFLQAGQLVEVCVDSRFSVGHSPRGTPTSLEVLVRVEIHDPEEVQWVVEFLPALERDLHIDIDQNVVQLARPENVLFNVYCKCDFPYAKSEWAPLLCRGWMPRVEPCPEGGFVLSFNRRVA